MTHMYIRMQVGRYGMVCYVCMYVVLPFKGLCVKLLLHFDFRTLDFHLLFFRISMF